MQSVLGEACWSGYGGWTWLSGRSLGLWQPNLGLLVMGLSIVLGSGGAVARFLGVRMVLSMPVANRTAGSVQALAQWPLSAHEGLC